jgi:DNA sulfur modification protein DndE
MQPINIKTSAANKEVVSRLTQKLPGEAKENIIARIALGFSLSTGKRFSQHEIIRPKYDS